MKNYRGAAMGAALMFASGCWSAEKPKPVDMDFYNWQAKKLQPVFSEPQLGIRKPMVYTHSFSNNMPQHIREGIEGHGYALSNGFANKFEAKTGEAVTSIDFIWENYSVKVDIFATGIDGDIEKKVMERVIGLALDYLNSDELVEPDVKVVVPRSSFDITGMTVTLGPIENDRRVLIYPVAGIRGKASAKVFVNKEGVSGKEELPTNESMERGVEHYVESGSGEIVVKTQRVRVLCSTHKEAIGKPVYYQSPVACTIIAQLSEKTRRNIESDIKKGLKPQDSLFREIRKENRMASILSGAFLKDRLREEISDEDDPDKMLLGAGDQIVEKERENFLSEIRKGASRRELINLMVRRYSADWEFLGE